MNINYKEPQFELFPANSATLEDINKPRFLLATFTLSIENLVILLILGIMIGLFSYSLGVERGRSFAAQSLDEKAAAAWNVGGRRLATIGAGQSAANLSVQPKLTVKSSSVPLLKASTLKTEPKVIMPSSIGNKWKVQFATYRSEKYAQQDALGLKAKGYPVFIVKNKDFYLVNIGPLANQAQADAISKKIQGKIKAVK